MAALLAGVAIFAQTPLPDPAPHPRLFLSDRDFDEIRSRVAATGTGDHASPHQTALAAMHELIMVRAATAGLTDAPLSMAFDAGGLRMLDTSRSALERILLCSYAYRFSGERRFLDHAASDLRAVCSFSDWNADRHFLDTAEMALAVGIGYDWLYDELCEDDRSAIISALKRNAFDPAADEDTAWFYYAEGNWNQVCNAGLAAAALATYEACDTTAQRIIDDAIWSNRRAMHAIYSPSGCYVEGPNYWNYGNAFQVLLLTLLEQTFGSDFGLSETEGFSRTAQYRQMTQRPCGGIFNYSDNISEVKPSYALWYFADRFNDPSLVKAERQMMLGSFTADEAGFVRYDDSSEARLLPLLMTYMLKVGTSEVKRSQELQADGFRTSDLPQVYINKGREGILEDAPLMIVKGSDYYLGAKGGSPTANHAHMDGGSFVYDAFGSTWFIDPDRDSYQELEAECGRLGGDFWDMSQESVRWQMSGMGNRWHNTITINDRDFRVKGKASFTEIIDTGTENGTVIDMTSLYEGEADCVTRRIAVGTDGHLSIEDSITASSGKDAMVRWTFVTPAEVTVSRKGITLRSGGTMIQLRTESRARVTYRLFPSGSDTYRICGFEAKVRKGKTVVFRSWVGSR